jgi:hypothetical protein
MPYVDPIGDHTQKRTAAAIKCVSESTSDVAPILSDSTDKDDAVNLSE